MLRVIFIIATTTRYADDSQLPAHAISASRFGRDGHAPNVRGERRISVGRGS